jgi:hypothetical protein
MPNFSEAEWNLMRDACNSWASIAEPPEIASQGLPLQIADAIEFERLDVKWQVGKQSLIAKLRALTPLQAIATLDAIERYWRVDQSS